MRKIVLYLVTLLIVLGCDKDNQTSTTTSIPSSHSSKTVLYDVNNPFDGSDDDYCFMLLGADNSAQKKYFKAKMIDVVSDSMEIISGPYTLDSIIDVSTFPGYIKSANSGSFLSDFVFADSVRMSLIGTNAQGKRMYSSSAWGSSSAIRPYTKGAQVEGTTIMNYIKIPTASGGYLGYQVHFFFDIEKCYVYGTAASSGGVPAANVIEDISTVIGASYDWKNVDNFFQVPGPSATTQHYFIDYKNWRYFRIKEFKTSVPGTPGGQYAIEYGGYKSLDKLLKWPAEWKK